MRGQARRSGSVRLTRFPTHCRGAITPVFALAAVPLIIAVGSSVDIGRVLEVHAELQDIADAGSIAGATQMGSVGNPVQAATNFVNGAVSRLPGKPTVTGTYAYDSTANTVKVVLSSSIATTFSSFMMPLVTTTVQSLATGTVVRNVTYKLNQANASDPDTDKIYYYTLPTGSSGTTLYQQVPTMSNSNLLYSNAPGASNAASTSFQVPLNTSVYFALANTTGSYGQNCYGQKAGTTYTYYSHREDSQDSYWDYGVPAFTACTTDPNAWSGSVPSGGNIMLMPCNSSDAYLFPDIGGTCQSTASYAAGAYVYYADSNASYQGYDPLYGTPYSRNPLKFGTTNTDCTQGNVQLLWDNNGGATDTNAYNTVVFTVNCQALAVQQSTIRLLS